MNHINRSHGEGEEESIWQVVYIDFLTMMTTIFLIFAFSQKMGAGGGYEPQKIELKGDNSFEKGKSIVKDQMKKKLHEAFSIIKSNKEIVFKVTGHTDQDGLKESNLLLSFQRAYSVYDTISKIMPNLPNQVVLCAAADNVPKVKLSKSSAARPELVERIKSDNRRIEIEMEQFKQMKENEKSAL